MENHFGNKFELIQSLGKGTFCQVYKIKNKYDNKYYVLKKIELNDEEQKQKIEEEARILSDSKIFFFFLGRKLF